MNHREPPHLPAAARRAMHCLSLLLLPTLAPKGADALPRSRTGAEGGRRQTTPSSTLYLAVLGAPALRFQEAAPPPDLTTLPPAAAPPQPALSPQENSVAADNAAALRSVSAPPHPPAAVPLPEPKPAAVEAPVIVKQPPAILPDDSRPSIRPEEFLPYFQVPGAARRSGDVTLFGSVPSSAPVPAAIPPSSATYTQSPK